MKTNFSPQLFRMPGLGDVLGSAIGSTPWGAVAQIGAGLFQSGIGALSAKKNQKKLERLQTPTYNQSSSIMDYYNKALTRYNVNPYQSQQYQYATNAANRATASGLSALQGRGSAVGGIAKLTGLQNDAMLRAGIAAEQEQNQRFGQLGGATQMKAGEEFKQFQYNKIAPYEKQYNLLAQKAGAANQTTNAGLQNIFGGLSSINDYNMINKMYGSNSIGGVGGGLPSFDMGVYNSLQRNRGRRVG